MPPSPFRSRHNQLYWGYDTQWYAIGLGASSFVANVTIARPRTMSDYVRWVASQENAMPFKSEGQDALLDELESLVMKRLRTSDGLSLKYIETRYGAVFVDAIQKGIQLGCMFNMVSIDDIDTVRLTDPKGFLFSNSIISSIFFELHAAIQLKT
jgi:coproporphyrinogen III oxidase-like Fe-S oxidoreductase